MDGEKEMRAEVVAMILDKNPEGAIEKMAKWYKVPVPKLGVGVVEGKTKGVAAVYSVRKKKIFAANSEYLYDPFVIVHEFYHHLRSRTGKHRGTEKEADRFAQRFILDFLELKSMSLDGRQFADQMSSSFSKTV